VGVESTIIDSTGLLQRVLRPGAVSTAMIEEVTGLKAISVNGADVIRVSGSLENHYAPVAKVLLCEIPIVGQGFIAYADIETPPGVIRLASPKNDEEYAQVLYSALREADRLALAEVAVMQPVGMGIAIAIRDRLKRASFRTE
jgi:L-threonylcarbamoyladenylate synthase